MTGKDLKKFMYKNFYKQIDFTKVAIILYKRFPKKGTDNCY